MVLNTKQLKTLKAIFEIPTRSNILWEDIENLCRACGAEVIPARGSRIAVVLKQKRAVFHRPHPHKETDKGAVVSVRKFLINAGIVPDIFDVR